MGAAVGIGVAAALAAGLTWWWYARREERVRGRTGPAVLRGVALFLALASPWLPSVGGGTGSSRLTAVLLDTSLSMSLPASSAAPSSRMERAADTVRALAQRSRGVSVWTFGQEVDPMVPVSADEATSEPVAGAATHLASRLVPAIEIARAAGADTVIVVTDGELEDREAARSLAERYGLAMREARVAEQVFAPAIRALTAPRAASAGDTLRLDVEVVTRTEASGQVAVSAAGSSFGDSRVQIDRPTPGRASTARFRIPVDLPDTAEWRSLDVRIDGLQEPWREAAERRLWVRVTPQPTGAVLVSLDPDWEPRYLLPLLRRAAPGGARTFLRLAEDLYSSGGTVPETGIDEASVRNAAERATLLVVQGNPDDLPAWLARAMSARPALLFLPRGSGTVPGTGVEIREALEGDWYASGPPPAGPLSAYVSGIDPDGLPPVFRLYGSTGRPDWVALEASRDRRGDGRPVATLGSAPGRRWAVVHAEGTWRWAARGGTGRDLYRGLYAGIANWLAERSAPQPVQLVDPMPARGEPLLWRISPGVSDLSLSVRAGADTVWAGTNAAPGELVEGPVLESGDMAFSVAGRLAEREFEFEAPFHVEPAEELIPGPFGAALDVAAPAVERDAPGAGAGRPPVWPFVVAALLLCAEWLWRRRVGLR